MTEIGRAAIDVGADIVIGHGPHYSLPVELYKGRPIYYGLGCLCFKTGHGGRQHANWVGMVAEITVESGKDVTHAFRLVRHSESYEALFSLPADEAELLADLTARSKALGATFSIEGDRVRVAP